MIAVGPNLLAIGWTLPSNLAVSAAASAIIGVGDPRSTRIVYAMVTGLALVGLLFVLLAIWVIRQTRVDLEMLAPLERMGDREWRKSDPASQRRSLDEVRPADAEPLQSEPHRPRVDSEFDESERPVQSFDDLSPLDAEGVDQTPTGTESEEFDLTYTEPKTENPAAEDSDADDSDADESEAGRAEPEESVADGAEAEADRAEAEESETDKSEAEGSVAGRAEAETESHDPESEADASAEQSAQRVEQ